MKKHLIFFSALSAFTITSCGIDGNKGKARILPFEFNDKGLKVITTAINNRAETMSILYGNAPALKMAIEGKGIHSPGEVFTLVTKKQVSHRFWYGSMINSPLISVRS